MIDLSRTAAVLAAASLGADALARPAGTLAYTIETARPRQTIRHFGASDCWSMWQIGRWSERSRRKVADWLFSLETDADSRPKGIGLSLWRFNLGAGSSEQGDDSQIDRWTRTECMLRPDGSWDWSKQSAERGFLKLAKERGVENFLAFCNSAPVQFTKNGLATNTGRGETINLRDDCYDDFADYLAKAVKGIERHDGVKIGLISPVNEPDGYWNWQGPKQEGSPALDIEVARLARELDRALAANGVAAKILINEASDYRCLIDVRNTGEDRGFHLRHFFGSAGGETDVSSLARVLKTIGAHSYWSNTPVDFMREIRLKVRDEAARYGVGFWQTEYCIMSNDKEIGGGGGYDFGMKTALYVARLIHHDLCFADAGSWSWWRAAGAGDYRDCLVKVFAREGMTRGWAVDSKLLWTFGNFSRFVRPGAVRYELTCRDGSGAVRDEGWNEPFGVMCSAYRNADGRWCVVAINYSPDIRAAAFALSGGAEPKWRLYRTSDAPSENLAPVGVSRGRCLLAPRSVTTLVEMRWNERFDGNNKR